MGLARRSFDRNRTDAVRHLKAGRDGELQFKIGVGEGLPLDHTLCRVVVDPDAVELIEERIAYGKVIVRIITRKDVTQLIQFLNAQTFRYTKVVAEGPDGNENLVFTVLQRERLDDLLEKLKEILPSAFYTIEKVKAAGESGALPEEQGGWRLFTWLRGVIRN